MGFFIMINCIEGKGVQHGVADIKSKLVETMIVNWKIWIPANFVNFYFVPVPYQVLWANFISLGYNCCLSYIYNKPEKR